MLIFLKHHLVFFATPKTASTALETTIGHMCDIRLSKNPSVKHTPYRKYKRLLEPFVKTVMSEPPDHIAVCREPIDWLGSWYRYRGRQELIGKANSTHGITFNQFVESYLEDTPPAYAKVGSQAKFMTSKDGELKMSQLFSYDKLNELVTYLEQRLKTKISLPHTNVSPKAHIELSPMLEKTLKDKFHHDFEIYHSI